MPSIASARPPASLAITGMPRAIASRMMRDRASAQSEGTSATRVWRITSSMSSTGGRMVTLGSAAQGREIGLRVVPQVGTAANSTRRQPLGQRQEDRDAFHRAWIHHGDEAIVEAADRRDTRPAPSSEMGTCTASMPPHWRA